MAERAGPCVPNAVPAMVPVDICGLSGRFPESSSASEFFCNLVSGLNMVTADSEAARTWRPELYPDIPARFGKLRAGELFSFDPSFFGVHGQQAKRMDPQVYKLLEVSWEAWMDSGIDVRALRDSNRVGVYTGVCGSEVHGLYLMDEAAITGYEQTGCVVSMMANRLSFFYSFRGPSKTCDTACSSAAHSLHDAIADISAGRIDYAVVLGTTVILMPSLTLAFNRLHMLSPEGACKSFDASGNGYARSECVAAIILKRSDLEQTPLFTKSTPYATILNCGINNDGYTPEGITFPSRHAQYALSQQVCNEANINPADIVYVEAHGTGTVAGDGQELDSIDRWYGRAPGRTEPLKIGSVKSNMGHCEGGSGLASVIKMCLALEYGLIPGNLHYSNPNPDSLGLKEGTLQVVKDTQEWNGGHVALSSFGFGGANMHLVMKGQARQRTELHQIGNSPSLLGLDDDDEDALGNKPAQPIIPLAARTADGLAYLAQVVKKAEEADKASFAEPLRRYAGTVASDMRLSHRGTLSGGKLKAGAAVSTQPQIYFAFSGNGSQWSQMASGLLDSSATFQQSVSACAAVVAPLGIDLLEEFRLANGWKAPLLGAVGLLAVQIGLVDVLHQDYGIRPDGMLGHSAGEIACTYASGCCSKEQAMLIAYHRGRLPMKHNIKSGLMAATGLTPEQARERLQGSRVVLACENSPSSTTISGDAKEVRAVLKQLEAEEVFNRALDTNGVPYHSPELDPLLGELRASLEEVMPEPEERPATWLSTAYPATSDDPDAKLCSAQYQVHSYRNAVLFASAAKDIPSNALLVEIGPHSILRSPLRQCRPDLAYVSTMTRNKEAAQTLEDAVSEMWQSGVPVAWNAAPLPTNASGTELPRSVREALVSWDRQRFDETSAMPFRAGPGRLYQRVYDLAGKDAYINDHVIDGTVYMPLSSFLVTAWEAFARWEEKTIWEHPVEFLDMQVNTPIQVEKNGKVVVSCLIDFNNHFQVLHGKDIICTGIIKAYKPEERLPKEKMPQKYDHALSEGDRKAREKAGIAFDHLDSNQWYQICKRQSLEYGPKFRKVHRKALDRSWSELNWDHNWVTHLDSAFQAAGPLTDNNVHMARGVRRIAIMDTMKDVEPGYIERLDCDLRWKIHRGRSFVLEDYKYEITTRKGKAAKTLLQKHIWLPYGLDTSKNTQQAAYAQEVLSYVQNLIASSNEPTPVMLEIQKMLDNLPSVHHDAHEAGVAEESRTIMQLLSDIVQRNAGLPRDGLVQHADFSKACEQDPLLKVNNQVDLDAMLGIAISNMKASGYTVGEVGAGVTGLTKQALLTCVKAPKSALLSYTALLSGEQASNAKRIQHNAVTYRDWNVDASAAAPSGPFDLVLARHLSYTAKDLTSALRNLYDSTAEGGFVMLEELVGPLGTAVFGMPAQQQADKRQHGVATSVEHWRQLLAAAGFAEVRTVKCPSGASATFLWRRLAAQPVKAILMQTAPFVADNETMDAWLDKYRAALDEADGSDDQQPGAVWLYGDFEKQPGLIGFMHSARKELKGDRLRTLVGWGEQPLDYAQALQSVRKLDLVINVIKDGRNGIYGSNETEFSVERTELECDTGAHLNFETYGNLKSAVWRQNPPFPKDAGVVACNVSYGALNFRDVMLAYGKLSKQAMAHDRGGSNIGFEFSGHLEGTGQRVMGNAPNAISTKLATRANVMWEVPDSWSLAEAATVPTAYTTAYYALVMRGRLRRGMRVLIHSGTGAVGLAAIQICLFRGAEVFTTVGSPAKRQFLLDTFPGLRDNHIGDSRSTSFESMVVNLTDSKGVHLVLNSLSDDKLQASVRCIGNFGKLLEIGKYDILQGTPLSMLPLLNNVAFEGVDVDRVMNHPDSTETDELHQLLAEGLKTGEVRPLPVTVFPRTDIEEAFRFLAGGTHIGKVLVDTRQAAEQPLSRHCMGPQEAAPSVTSHVQQSQLPPLPVQPHLNFRSDRSYIITGGLGGFGRAWADYMAQHGARHLVLTSGRGVTDPLQLGLLNDLAATGVEFCITRLDIGKADEAREIIKLAGNMAPVGGIFHLAAYLADRLLANQTGESWNTIMHAKAHGAYNLDKASRGIDTLEHFVLWSSLVAAFGNEGQTNYSFANASLDVLAEMRRAEGLPALSVQWGVIGGVGMADDSIQELMEGGLLGSSMAQPITSCVSTLEKLLLNKAPAPVMSSSWQQLDILGKSSGSDAKKNLLSSILTVMGLNEGSVTATDSLSRLGIDSMQVVEVRANLQRALNRAVALEDVQSMTIADIKAIQGTDAAADEAAGGSDAAAPAQSSASGQPEAAAEFRPAKIVNLARDLPVDIPVKPPALIKAEYSKAAAKRDDASVSSESTSSALAPGTPEKDIDSAKESSSDGKPKMRTTSDSAMDLASNLSKRLTSRMPRQAKQLATEASSLAQAATAAPLRSVSSSESWGLLSQLFLFVMTAALGVMSYAAFTAAASVASKFGVVAALLVLPVLYLLLGAATVAFTVLTKWAVLPSFEDGQRIPMWSADFAKWWLVCRLMDITNVVFMNNFKGSLLANWYLNLLGARVPDSAFVDSLDIADPDLLDVGEEVAIGEGATLLPHIMKDGFLTFQQVRIPANATVQPYALVTPETETRAGEVLGVFAKESSPVTKLPSNLGIIASNFISSQPLGQARYTIGQVAAVIAIQLLTGVAATMGCGVYALALEFMGVSSNLGPASCVATALVAMSSPLLALFAAFVLPVPGLSGVALRAAAPALAASFAALPIAVTAAMVAHVALAACVKALLIGSVEAGLHRQHSVYGLLHWSCRRLVEGTLTRYGDIIAGTWAMSALYRAFGAPIGSLCAIRNKAPGMNIPDMLQLNNNVVIGDTTKVVTCMPLDSQQMLTAPVFVDNYALLGAASVTLPGASIGHHATVSPLAVIDAGSDIQLKAICMGAPAKVVKVEEREAPEAAGIPPMPLGWLGMVAAPFAQIFAVTTMTIASHVPCGILAMKVAAANPGFLGIVAASYAAKTLQSLLIGYLLSILHARTRVFRRQTGAKQWSIDWLIGCLVAVVTQYCSCFGGIMGKSSPSFMSFLRSIGIHVGKGVYCDADWPGEFGVSLEDGAVVERGAMVYGHWLKFDGQCNKVEYAPVRIGANAYVGPRSALLPGVTVGPGQSVAGGAMQMAI